MFKIFKIFIILFFTSCGTKVFHNQISVTSSHLVNSENRIVSIFDYKMGDSRDWILKQGKHADATGKVLLNFSSLKTVAIFDSSLPDNLSFGLAIPSITDSGFFAITIEGKEVINEIYMLTYVAYYGRNNEPKPKIHEIRYSMQKGQNGWVLEIQI